MRQPPNLIIKLESTDASVKRAASHLEWALGEWPDLQHARFWLIGYDDDEREVDEIPEARKTLESFAREIGFDGIARFRREQAFLLFVCLGLGGRVGDILWIHKAAADFLDSYGCC